MCAGAEPRWSLAELIHAVILMAHTHSLCSFVWGCGLNPEPDHIGGYAFHPPSPSHIPRSPYSPAHEDGRQEVSHSHSHQQSDRLPVLTKAGNLSAYQLFCRLCAYKHHNFDGLQLVDGAVEVEVLMKRMVELQQEEECTQEEMVTRFERERSESIPTGKNTPVYCRSLRRPLGYLLT